MDRLALQVQEAEKLLSIPSADWKDISLAMKEVADAVESLEKSACYKDALRLLMSLSDGISVQLVSIRSKLVKDTCECLLRIVTVMGQDFQGMANALLPQIIGTARMSSTAIRQPGSNLLRKMSEVVRYDLTLMRKIYVQILHVKAHVLVLEQLRVIFVYWKDDEVLPYEADVLEMIRRGLEDQNEMVRTTAREALANFSSRWSDRVDKLMNLPLIKSKSLFVSEHRDSPLAEAILKINPEIIIKTDTFSRSKLAFTQSRIKHEPKVEIHFTESTPPKLRDGLRNLNPEYFPTEDSADPCTAHELHAVSQYSFDNPDLSGGGEEDQQEGLLEAFDGSQMHEFHPELSSENVLPLAPELNGVSPDSSFSSGSRSSSAYTGSGEAAAALTLSDQTRKKSRTRSTRSQSLSPLSKKPLEVSPSPTLPPSLLTCPSNFTLEAHTSSELRSPVRGAKCDEMIAEASPLSASDEFFSKQLPSSNATPPLMPTDNITLRSRRVPLRLDQNDIQLQTNDPKLPTLESQQLDQLQQAETIPPLIVCNSLVDQNMPSSFLEQLSADIASNEADAIEQLTERIDHAKMNYERDRHQLSENRSSSVELESEQLILSATSGRTLSDENHLDEEFGNKFGAEDESGDYLSDEDQKWGNYTSAINNDFDQCLTKPKNSYSDSNDDVRLVGQGRSFSDHEKAGMEQENLHAVNFSNDPLAGLLNVCKEMKNLREVTRNIETKHEGTPEEEHAASTTCHSISASAADELHESALAMCAVQSSDKPVSKKLSYLERLKQADKYARNLLVGPPVISSDGQGGGYTGEQSLSVTGQPLISQAVASNDEHEQIFEKDLLVLQTQPSSPPWVFERATEEHDEGFLNPVINSQLAENTSRRTKLNAGHQENSQNRESHIAHDQSSRFDAAEKLFAEKETLLVHDNTQLSHEPYSKPNLPKCLPTKVHSTRLKPRYPPTRMGAKLTFACGRNAGNNALVEEVIAYDADEAETLEQAGEDFPLSHPAGSDDEMAAPATTKVRHVDVTPSLQTSLPNGAPERNLPAAKQKRFYSFGFYLAMFLSAVFCIAGVLHAAKKVNESHRYHLDLKSRIDKFEASIAESHSKVLKLEKDYTVWTEYVRKLAEEDEANALTQLQALHAEVQKWQQDMHEDLMQFRKALTVDSIDAAFAKLNANEIEELEE